MSAITLEYPASGLATLGLDAEHFAEETKIAAAMKLLNALASPTVRTLSLTELPVRSSCFRVVEAGTDFGPSPCAVRRAPLSRLFTPSVVDDLIR